MIFPFSMVADSPHFGLAWQFGSQTVRALVMEPRSDGVATIALPGIQDIQFAPEGPQAASWLEWPGVYIIGHNTLPDT